MRGLARAVSFLVWPGLMVIGLPVGLLHMPDRPSLPRHWPSNAQWAALAEQPMSRDTAVACVIVLGWLGWAILVYAILTDVRRWAVRVRRRLPQMRMPGPLQSLSAAILGTVAVSSAGTAASAALPPAIHVGLTQPTDTGHPAAAVTSPTSRSVDASSRTTPTGAVTSGATAVVRAGNQHYAYTVHRGDTLWHIAAKWLGDPTRWPEIYHLNQDHYDQHGRMRHGDHIQTGWVLVLPDDATPPSGTRPASPPPQPGSAHRLTPGSPASRSPSPTPSQATTPASSSDGDTPTRTGTPSSAPAECADSTNPQQARTHDATTTPSGVGTAPPRSMMAAPASPSPTHSPGSPARRSSRPRGVDLPGDSWVDLGLAVAVAAAVTLVWAHRRHRYTPQPPSPDLRRGDPNLAPMPPVIAHIRRGLRRVAAASTTRTAEPNDGTADLLDDLDDTAGGHEQTASANPAGESAEPDTAASGTAEKTLPWAAVLASAHSMPSPAAGLGLTGPGAQAAGRGLLAAALAAGGLDDPDARLEVVIGSATAAALLGAAALPLPATPRLRVTADLGEALEFLEAQALHRTRLLEQQEAADIAELLHAAPYTEPVPPIVLITDEVPDQEQARMAALLAAGALLRIHGVVIGPWLTGTTIAVADDGTTAWADDEAHQGSDPREIGRLTVLNPTETRDLIATLAESHTGLPQPPPTSAQVATTRAIHAPVTPTDIPLPEPVKQPAPRPVQPPGGEGPTAETFAPQAPSPSVAAYPTPSQANTPDLGETDAPDTAASATQVDDFPTAGADTVAVTVLGGAAINGADPAYHLRAKALELLVYLIVHDGAARHDAILDDLIPEAPASKAPHRMHTYVSSLRQALRRTSGHGANFVNHTPLQYTLTVRLFDIDLWRMRDALRQAQHATDPHTRAAALRRAIDTYQGPLADGFDYEWIEPYRHAIGQQILDAHLALAETLDGQPTQQLPILHAAIDLDPHAEPAYQQAMRAHAALGNLDAIRNLRRALARRLAEIDAEPSDDTLTLADQLVAQLQHRQRRSGHSSETPRQGQGAAA